MKFQRTLALLLGVVAIATPTCGAQAQRTRAPADMQKDYDQFIVKFRTALKANDGAAVAQMTRFPFFWMEERDEAYFRKNFYGKFFTAKTRACIARGKGLYESSSSGEGYFTIFCGLDRLVFTKTSGGFRFAEVGFND